MIQEVPFRPRFFLGHTKPFAADTLGFVLACAEAGMPMARARIAFRDFVILLDHEAIRHVLQKNHRNYIKSFAYRGLKEFLGNGLLTAEGDRWLNNRRALQPAFHRLEIAKMEKAMDEVVAGKLENIPIGEEVNLQPLFLEWTRDILLKSLFDLEPDHIVGMKNMHTHLWFLRNYANDRMKNPLMAPRSWPTKTNRNFRIAVKELESIILEIFRVSSQNADHGQLVQHILEQKRKGQWNDQQIFDEIITLFLAGQETTTNAMIFLVHCLLKHPEVLKRVLDQNDDLGWDQVIMEVLRLYPPAWAVSREAVSDDILMGEPIRKGMTMFLSIYAMQRHPGLWIDPAKFKPDRFLGNYPKQAYLPFGLGPRMCIGNHFALLEMKIMTKKLFGKFRLEDIFGQQLDLITPMMMGPKRPYSVQFFKRS